jgi:hypothetical protein
MLENSFNDRATLVASGPKNGEKLRHSCGEASFETLVFPEGACCKDLKGTMWYNDASLMAISTVLIS